MEPESTTVSASVPGEDRSDDGRPPFAYDLPYLAAVHAAKGATHEGLGNRDAARARYQRAVALYADADPELAPVIAAARARLSALR